MCISGVSDADKFETARCQQASVGECVAQLFVSQIAGLLIGQRQAELAFLFRQLAGDAVGDDAQIIEARQPDMAFGGETGFRGAIFALLEGAGAEHLEQVSTGEGRFLLPE